MLIGARFRIDGVDIRDIKKIDFATGNWELVLAG
jgi:hypothetical protein